MVEATSQQQNSNARERAVLPLLLTMLSSFQNTFLISSY
jgi:hypothetical protein